MKYKTLFEIPIYSMSEKEFHKRWEKRKTFLHNLSWIIHGVAVKVAESYIVTVF